MNKQGKQQLNNEAVFNILTKATKLDDGSYVFIDLSNKIFLVNTDGTIYTVDDDVITPCNSGNVSSKKNGYLYINIAVEIDGQLTSIEYAQHSIVCALFNGVPYDYNMIVNHKDNCPFNNDPLNLEWTTQQLNTLHGRIVEAMTHLHNSTNGIAWLGFDLYKQYNNNKHNFDGLKIQLSCEDIKAYENHVGQKLTKFWNLSSKTSLLSNYDFEQFIVWWAKRNNVNLNSFKEVA